MTPHIQQADTAEPIAASQGARFAKLETAAPSLTGVVVANDNVTASKRPNILVSRRRRHARMTAR